GGSGGSVTISGTATDVIADGGSSDDLQGGEGGSITINGVVDSVTANSGHLFMPTTGSITIAAEGKVGSDLPGTLTLSADSDAKYYASILVTGTARMAGEIPGAATFAGSSLLIGDVYGNAEFYDTSVNGDENDWIDGIVFGDATFHDSSSNSANGYVYGTATFLDSTSAGGNYDSCSGNGC